MKKQTLIFAIIASLMILPILGCGSQPPADAQGLDLGKLLSGLNF